MTSLAHKLGLSKELVFSDVFSIDDPDLLNFVPRPSLAILLVFPVSKTYEDSRVKEDANLADYEGSGPDEPVMWFKQTIGNACGLIGLLHTMANGLAGQKYVTPGSDLDNLLKAATPLKAGDRAELLYQSKELEAAHGESAREGDSSAPEDNNVDLHFVCFVKGKDGQLYEMDGRRKGPLARSELSEDEDMLSERALASGVRKMIERESQGGDARFSLISLGKSLD